MNATRNIPGQNHFVEIMLRLIRRFVGWVWWPGQRRLMIRTTMPSMEPSVPTGSAIMWPASYTRFGEMRRGGDDMGVFSKISNEM